MSKSASTTQPVISQVFTYTLVFTVPTGLSLTNVYIEDNLPDNDPFYEEPDMVRNGAEGNYTGPTPLTAGTPDIESVTFCGSGSDDHNLCWNLPDLTNSSGQPYVYEMTYQAQVSESGSKRGETGTNQAILRWDGGSVADTLDVTVRAPALQLHRVVATADGAWAQDPGDPSSLEDLRANELVTVTVSVTNLVDSYASPAYDLRLLDELPDWIDYDSLISGDSPTSIGDEEVEWGATNRTGGTVDALNELGVGETFSVSYRARVEPTVPPNLTSRAYTRIYYYYGPGSSEQDDRGRLEFSTPSVEITKTVTDKGPELGRVRVGDVVTYTVVYTLPHGTTVYTPTYLEDELDDGMRFGGVVAQPSEVVGLDLDEAGEDDTILTWHMTAPLTLTVDLRQTFVITARTSPTFFLGSDAGLAVPQGQTLENEAQLSWDRGPWHFSGSDSGWASVGISLIRPGFDPEKWKADPLYQFDAPGEPVRFELRRIRNGDGTDDPDADVAYNVMVTDTLPQDWTYVSSDPPGVTSTLGSRTVITWSAVFSLGVGHYLPSGDATESVYVVTATPPLTVAVGAPYTNIVEVGYTSAEGYDYVDRDDLPVSLPLEHASKEITPAGPYRVGEVVTYSLVTAVPADSVLYWPRHIDTLPAGVRYAGSYRVRGGSLITPPTTGDDGDQETLTWWWNTLENSSSTEPLTFTLSFSAALTGVDLDGNREWDSYYRWRLGMDNESILEWNTKDISGTFGASKEVNRSDDVIQPYLVDLDPVKSLVGGGPVVEGGDLVTYTFTVYNTGRAPAYDVVVSDTLPPGMIFDSYQARVYPFSGSDYDPVTSMAPSMGQSDTIGWIFDEIAAGDGNTYDPTTHLVVTYTVRVLSDVGSGASLANSAWISDYSSLPGEQPYERHYDYLSDVGQRYSASPVTVPEAQIRKSADVTQVALGELVVFSITVPDPTLNATLYNAVVTDTLPVPLQVVDAWASGGAIPVVGTDETVTVDYGTLAAGVTATLVITARVPTTATGITGPNVAQVGWDDAVTNGASHTAQSNAVELVLTVPNMNVDKSAPVIVLPGGELIYQITYQNSGLATAKDVRLTDTLPISLSYTGFDASPPVTALASLPGPLVWDLGSLPPGDSGTIWLTTTVWSTATLGGILVNEVSIGTTSAGDDLSDNSDTTSTAIGGAVLEITKTAVPDPVLAGDLLHYSMTVRNVGSEATQNLIITDRVPLSTTFINASPSGSLVSDTVQWTPANLGVGEQSGVTFTVRVDSSLVSGTLIINQDYEAWGDNVAPGDPLPPVVVTVYDQRALLTVNKTATPDPVPAGELVHYTLTVRNGGNGIAQNLLVTDRVPLSTTFVSASPGGGWSAIRWSGCRRTFRWTTRR